MLFMEPGMPPEPLPPLPPKRAEGWPAPSATELERVFAECLSEFLQVARSFWLIPELIPQPDRTDVALLYCFCRQLDDAIDESSIEQARTELNQWRAEVRGERPARPLIFAFMGMAAERQLPISAVQHLLDGMALDLTTVRMTTDEELLRYSYRVSSVVGLLLAPLLGIRGHFLDRRIVDLGLALQLSNVLLGVVDDARRNRVYLPESRLKEAGLNADQVLAHPTIPALTPVLRGLAQLADRYYQSAEAGISGVPLRYRHGVLLLSRVYRELGWRAATRGMTPTIPAALSSSARLRHLIGLLGLACTPRVIGIGTPPPHDRALHTPLSATWDGVAPLEETT